MPDEPTVFSRILMATDFSSCSDDALRHAASMAELFQAQLTLLHVLPNVHDAMAAIPAAARWELAAGDLEAFEAALNRTSDRRLDKLLKRVKPCLIANRATSCGTPYIRIIQRVQSENYDMVLVGTHGHSGLRRLMVGSTAQRLVRHCPAPVWVVKPQRRAPPKAILTAVDFSDASQRALVAADAIARRSGAELHVMHIVDDSILAAALDAAFDIPEPPKRDVNRVMHERLAHFIAEHAPHAQNVHLRIAWGTPWARIARFAKRIKADVVVLGAIGRSGIPNLLLGNTAERVLQAAECSVLAVKPAGFVSHVQPALTVS